MISDDGASAVIVSLPPTRSTLLLQEPQDLGLQGQRHIANLVEENGTIIALLELPMRRRLPG